MTSPADPKSVQALPAWVAGNPVPPEARLGTVLQNEFHILRVLGQGELGVTYEAENARLKGKFAVLMLKRDLKPTQGMVVAAQRDLRLAQPLQPFGFLPVKMLVDQFGIPGFATELLDGETLRQRLKRGPLSVERALALAIYIGKALDAFHKAGAVHGDLRPENIFLVRPGAKSSLAGKVVLVEHGLYHLRRISSGLDDRLPPYKLMYRPPELLLGEIAPHPGADLFVLGAILHECLTGRPAFFDAVDDFIIDNLNQPPKPLVPNPQTGLTAELCQSVGEIIVCACARDPKERLPDMASFVTGLELIVKAKGLKLPDVLTENKGLTDVLEPIGDARMHQLLERRSGMFPVIGPPPPELAPTQTPSGTLSGTLSGTPSGTPSATPVIPPLTTPSAEEVKTQPRIDPLSVSVSGPASVSVSGPASGKPAEPTPVLVPITAPKKKVTQILERLSSAFPVLTVTPDGGAIQEQLVQPVSPPIPKSEPKPEAITQAPGPGPVKAAPPKFAEISPPEKGAPPSERPLEPAPLAHVVPEKKTPELQPADPTEPETAAEKTPAPAIPKAPTEPAAQADREKPPEPKPVLKAGVAEALARLKKPGAPVELKVPPPVTELPFAVPASALSAKLPSSESGPAQPEPAAKTAVAPSPPLAQADLPPERPSAPEKPPLAVSAIPNAPRRVFPTVQVENVEDMIVSLPSLAAIPVVTAPPPMPGAQPTEDKAKTPDTLSELPTQAVLDVPKIERLHNPALLSAPTQPLIPAMLGELLTPPFVAPPAALAPPTPTPSVASQQPASLHEAPTQARLPSISSDPRIMPDADQPATVQAVQIVPLAAMGSRPVESDVPVSPQAGLHEVPTAAAIPSSDLLKQAMPGFHSGPLANGPLADPQKVFESNPIPRKEATPVPAPSVVPPPVAPPPSDDAVLKDALLPAQVSTVHSSFAPKKHSKAPLVLPQNKEPTLKEVLLKHQELFAASIGALLVLLLGLVFYAIIR